MPGGNHQALLFDKNRGTHVLAEVGSQVEGYQVEDITDDTVTLSANGTQLVLAAPGAAGRRRDRAGQRREEDAPRPAEPLRSAGCAASMSTAGPADPYAAALEAAPARARTRARSAAPVDAVRRVPARQARRAAASSRPPRLRQPAPAPASASGRDACRRPAKPPPRLPPADAGTRDDRRRPGRRRAIRRLTLTARRAVAPALRRLHQARQRRRSTARSPPNAASSVDGVVRRLALFARAGLARRRHRHRGRWPAAALARRRRRALRPRVKRPEHLDLGASPRRRSRRPLARDDQVGA